MQNNPAEHLHIEMTHSKDSFSGFTHDGKGFGEEVAEEIVHLGVGASLLELAAKLEGFPTQCVVRKSNDVFLDRVDV